MSPTLVHATHATLRIGTAWVLFNASILVALGALYALEQAWPALFGGLGRKQRRPVSRISSRWP